MPSQGPSNQPSLDPSSVPSALPSQGPSIQPSLEPSSVPSALPSSVPSAMPSQGPSNQPSLEPTTSVEPSGAPSDHPSESVQPSSLPSNEPSYVSTLSQRLRDLINSVQGLSEDDDIGGLAAAVLLVYLNGAEKAISKGDADKAIKLLGKAGNAMNAFENKGWINDTNAEDFVKETESIIMSLENGDLANEAIMDLSNIYGQSDHASEPNAFAENILSQDVESLMYMLEVVENKEEKST